MTQLEIIAEKATATIFLNAQWIAHLAGTLEDNGLYDDIARQFVEHARSENKQAFSSINELRKQAQADTIPRATVAAALRGLRDELVIDTAASWADGTLSPKGRGIEAARIKLDATIAALGLEPDAFDALIASRPDVLEKLADEALEEKK